jgi:hypothetical protein
MIILAAYVIRGIAVGAIAAANSAAEWAARQVPNIGDLTHEQTLCLQRLYAAAAQHGVSRDDVWGAIEALRAGLASGEMDPAVVPWFAALDDDLRKQALLLVAR